MKVAVLITGQLRDYKINCTNHIRHLIEPNNADVFIYATTKNTMHSCGQSLTQKYNTTTVVTKDQITDDVSRIYGQHLKKLVVNENEALPDENFGSLGYFRTRMQNQINNIRNGFDLAKTHEAENDSKYDIIVRCRPDNAIFPTVVDFSKTNLRFDDNVVYSTIFMPSGHRDLCFFAVAAPKAFDKYSSYQYLAGEDPNRMDGNFMCTEHAWEQWLVSNSTKVAYIPNICRPFTQFDKTKPISDFPFRNKHEKLIDYNGNLVDQVEPE